MLPIIEVPGSVAVGMEKYRGIFCREEGHEHVSRYVTGLITSANKTLQGIYDQQVWKGKKPSRRAMHEAVFESGWDIAELMRGHRGEVSLEHRGQGREVISLDWTFSHHERGSKIYGVKKVYDYVEKRPSQYQTVMTAVTSNRSYIDGLEVVVQEPNYEEEEMGYLNSTVKESYEQMEAVRQRVLELLSYLRNRLKYKKRTEIALEMVKELEGEGKFPGADYAFDNGVLTVELTDHIEGCGKHWVSELEKSRKIQWKGQWLGVAEAAQMLKEQHPEGFRPIKVRCRNGELKTFWAFTKVVRLRKYGKKRLVIFHESEDLSDDPHSLLTDANHWESGRVIQTWNYRWSSEIFHEFAKQITGFESAQLRKEEAVKRHFCLSCVAQSLIQRVSALESKSERFEFAEGKTTCGQKVRVIVREIFLSLLHYIEHLFNQGESPDQVLEVLMPA